MPTKQLLCKPGETAWDHRIHTFMVDGKPVLTMNVHTILVALLIGRAICLLGTMTAAVSITPQNYVIPLSTIGFYAGFGTLLAAISYKIRK